MFFEKSKSFNKVSSYEKNVDLFNEATDFFKEGDFASALDIFLKLNEYDFEKSEVLIGMSLSYKGLHKYEESLDCINNALKLNSSFRELNIKGEILVHLGRYEESLKVLDKAISTNDKKVNLAKLTKVKALRELDRVEDAIKLLDDINFNDTELSDAKLWNIKGNDYFYLDQYEKSIDCYFNALDSGYDECDSYFNIANAYAQLEEYDDALFFYDKTLEYNKDDADLWYNRSLTLYYLDKYEDALFSIDKALDIDYKSSFLYNKAGFLFKSGDFNNSLDIYKNLLEKSPKDTDLLLNICMVSYELEFFRDVLKYSENVLSQDRNNEDALFYKFKALKGLKQYDDALKYVDVLINFNPTVEKYIDERTQLLELMKRKLN